MGLKQFGGVAIVNSLTTVDYLLEVFIRLWIHPMVRVFTSASTENLSQSFMDTFSVSS